MDDGDQKKSLAQPQLSPTSASTTSDAIHKPVDQSECAVHDQAVAQLQPHETAVPVDLSHRYSRCYWARDGHCYGCGFDGKWYTLQ